MLLHDREKDYLLLLLEKFSSAFFITIKNFCLMSNHVHLVLAHQENEAKNASEEELLLRYRLIYGENAKPPAGSYDLNSAVIPDEDLGIERLRQRLSSISRFVQELKQSFRKWYNKNHDFKGYLWSGRYDSVILDQGEAELVCSAYIDLNPLRANIVEQPEDYRWSGLGLRVRKPKHLKKLSTMIALPVPLLPGQKSPGPGSKTLWKSRNVNELALYWYQEFVHRSGGVKRKGKANLPSELLQDVIRLHGELGIGDTFRCRVRNITGGIALGGYSFICNIQKKMKRKFVRPRPVFSGERLFVMRLLRG
jgi:REP element-mobilizing transposase RayT